MAPLQQKNHVLLPHNITGYRLLDPLLLLLNKHTIQILSFFGLSFDFSDDWTQILYILRDICVSIAPGQSTK